MSTQTQFRTKVPTYRQRKGYSQALVTLTDSQTRERRDYWLGEYDSAESREAYHRTIAAWEAGNRRLPSRDRGQIVNGLSAGPSVAEIARDYWRWAEGYYRPNHVHPLVGALRLLKAFYGRTPANQFGPNDLRLLRDAMINGDPNSDPPRKPWSRKYINSQMQRLRHVFKWSAARQLVPASVHQSLCTLEPLRRGRSGARENPKVLPVPEHLLNGVRPTLSRPVRAVVELQLLTGARPGELLSLRPIDIQMDETTGVWLVRPESHKNAYREKERVIYLGPRAQEVVRPFLCDRPTHAFLFSPSEADTEQRARRTASRKTPISCGNVRGSNRKESPKRGPRDHYTTNSYCRAIQYACDRAFPAPIGIAQLENETRAEWQTRLRVEKRFDELKVWRKSHRWHPHQLRHNAATLLRKQFGLEAAQLALGHASAQVTDAVYAERDHMKVVEIMKKIG